MSSQPHHSVVLALAIVALAGVPAVEACIQSGDCSIDSDCGSGKVCSAGTCVECDVNDDCSAGKTCTNHACVGGGEGEGEGEGEGAGNTICCTFQGDGAPRAANCPRAGEGVCPAQSNPPQIPDGCQPIDGACPVP